jgi:hypothetical protein
LQINVTYDASAANAPAGFQQAVQAAVQFFETAISSNATVNIAFGWGEVNGQAIDPGAVGESLATRYPQDFTPSDGFSDLLAKVASQSGSPGIAASLSSDIPNQFTQGVSITTAQAKALGLAGPSSAIDGYVGLDASSTYTFDPANRSVAGAYDAIGILEHEISEVLGRRIDNLNETLFNLFRYSSPSYLAGNNGYFSLDGYLQLQTFNQLGGDPGDWAGGVTPDAFDAFATVGAQASVSAVDVRVLQALGYKISFLDPTPAGTPVAPVTISQAGGLGQGQSLSFDGQASLLFSPASAGMAYTNGGTISNSGARSQLDVVGVQWDPAGSALPRPAGDTFMNLASGVLTIQAQAFGGDGVGFFQGPDVINAGHVNVSSLAGDAWGAWRTNFTNSQTGVLTVQAAQNAMGLELFNGWQAAAFTGSNAGSIQVSGANAIGVEGMAFTNAQSGSIVVQGTAQAIGVNLKSYPTDVTTNAGTIQVSGSGIIGVSLSYADTFFNTGSITVAGGTGVLCNSECKVVNSGTITANGGGEVYGMVLSGGGLTNSGLVSATGDFAIGIKDRPAGSNPFNPNQSIISNSGTITATGVGAIGVSFTNFGGDVFVNSGTITVTSTAVNGPPCVISLDASGGVATVVNTGTIAISTDSAHFYNANSGVSTYPGAAISSAFYGSYALALVNSGTITGVVDGGISGAIRNSGSMNYVSLRGSGENLYDGAGGTLSGSIALAGTATAILGNEGETVTGSTGTAVVYGGTGNDVITGGSGNDVLSGGGGNDTLTGGGGSDTFVINGSVGQDVITDFNTALDLIDLSAFYSNFSSVQAASSQQGANTVIQLGGGGTLTLDNVTMSSLQASDFTFTPALNGTATLTGSSANNFTATFGGVFRQYTVWPKGMAVTGGPGGAGDTMDNVQRIQFVDGYMAYSPADTAAEVYRLYEVVLQRTPDQEGLTYWTNALNHGVSLVTVASGFIASAEYQTSYGWFDDATFVDQLYNAVLHRLPDPGGLAYWTSYMAQGHSRAEVAVGFSESQENINNFTVAVEQGLWVGNAYAAEAARLYDTALGRLPDVGGLAYWASALGSGTTLLQAAQGFIGSAEFQAVYGALGDSQFVQTLYQNALHRTADAGGLSFWTNYLTHGHSRAEVVVGFSESAEHTINLAPHIDSGIWVAG